MKKIAALLVIATSPLALGACSSSSDDATSSSSSPPVVSRPTTTSLAPTSTSEPDAPSTSSPASSSSSASTSESLPDEGTVLESMAAKFESKPGTPRGGLGPAPDPTNASTQIEGFLKAYYSVDSKIDSTDGAGAMRAARYARSDMAEYMKAGWAATPAFKEAAKHHGYSTPEIVDSMKGEPSNTEKVVSQCKDITQVYRGDGGWTKKLPTQTWCAVATRTGTQWAVSSFEQIL